MSLMSNWPLQARPIIESGPTAEALGPILTSRFQAYGADTKRSIIQLATTSALFAGLLLLMGAAATKHNHWLILFPVLPTAGLLVRLFIIQHDCGHGSYFKSRAANDLVGRALSLVTLTPYGSWRQGHAIHHASAGNLDRRGRGDVETWTVAEYEAAPLLKKLAYRLYRNPLVMVGFGAPINFIVLQRLPVGHGFHNAKSRRSILSLDLALIAAFGLACLSFGFAPVLSSYLPVIVVASWMGNWLFYVQHQFDETHWERGNDWNFHVAALNGSSYFKLPRLLEWFSGHIGLHHVHHLCSRVPNYRLRACLEAAPELDRISRVITLRESVGCWQLTLWDERRRVMVGFRELRGKPANNAGCEKRAHCDGAG